MFCRLQPVACRQQSPGQVVKWLIRRPIGSHLLEGYTCPDTAGTKNHHEPSTGNEASMASSKTLNIGEIIEHTHTHIRIYCVCACMYIRTYTIIYILYIYICIQTHTHTYLYVEIYIHTHVYKYIIHTYASTHTYVYIYRM